MVMLVVIIHSGVAKWQVDLLVKASSRACPRRRLYVVRGACYFCRGAPQEPTQGRPICAPGRIRTCDTFFRREVLFP